MSYRTSSFRYLLFGFAWLGLFFTFLVPAAQAQTPSWSDNNGSCPAGYTETITEWTYFIESDSRNPACDDNPANSPNFVSNPSFIPGNACTSYPSSGYCTAEAPASCTPTYTNGSASCATYSGSYGIPATHTAGTASYTINSCTGDITYTGGCSVPSVPGCTDPAASNYNSNATTDNGSCSYTCTPIYTNGSAACATYAGSHGIPDTHTDGTWSYTVNSCTDVITYTGGCSAPPIGCMDPSYSPNGNYDATATTAGSCACASGYTRDGDACVVTPSCAAGEAGCELVTPTLDLASDIVFGFIGTRNWVMGTANGIDPSGNQIRFGIDDNNDSVIDRWTPQSGYLPSGASENILADTIPNTPGLYTYQVLVENSAGLRSDFQSHTFEIKNSGLRATPGACGASMTLNWNPVGGSYSDVTYGKTAGQTYWLRKEPPWTVRFPSNTSLTYYAHLGDDIEPSTTYQFQLILSVDGHYEDGRRVTHTATSPMITAMTSPSCDRPTANINVGSCVIEVGQNSCQASVSWTSNNVDGASVRKNDIEFSTSLSNSGMTQWLTYGSHDFSFYSGEGAIYSVQVSGTCVTGTAFDEASNTCVAVAPPSPVVNISTDRALVRIGQTANVEIEVSAPYPSICQIFGMDSNTVTYNHNGSSTDSESTYTGTTQPLKSTQIVTVTCTPNPAITGVPSSREAFRIDVIPTVEEI